MNAEHEKKRVEYAEKIIKDNHPFNRTVFTDEKKFNLDGPDNWSSWTDPNRKLLRQKRQMGGGGVMTWGMITPDGECIVKKMEGRIDSTGYQKTIEEPLNYLDTKYGRGGYWFQQDNAAIHTSRSTSKYFEDRNVKLLKHSARSPDLNPMENAWKVLSDEVYENRQYRDKQSLWESIDNSAKKVTNEKSDKVKGLFAGMRSRLLKVIKGKGKSTNE